MVGAAGMGIPGAKNTTVGELIVLEWGNTWKKSLQLEALDLGCCPMILTPSIVLRMVRNTVNSISSVTPTVVTLLGAEAHTICPAG